MKDAPHHIVYVEGNVDGTLGGSYFSLLYLVSGLDRSSYVPTVVFAAETPLIPRFQERRIRTVLRPMAAGFSTDRFPWKLATKLLNYFLGFVVEPVRLALFLKRERADILHLNNSIRGNHPWMLAARLARVPCLTHERGMDPAFSRRTRRLARGLRAVICISGAVRDNLVSCGLKNLSLAVVHNGLDASEMSVTRDASEIRREFGLAPSIRLIGIVGNIKPWKGQDVVIRAMANIADEFPDVVCLLVGDPASRSSSYRNEIESLIRQFGLEERVVITGFRPDIANYTAAMEILIHASVLPEPFGRVLLEAMALRKPVVASSGGAIPEIVVEGQTGITFPPGDFRALAEVLQHLLRRPDLAAEMGGRGYERLRTTFSVARNIDQTQSIYNAILGEQ